VGKAKRTLKAVHGSSPPIVLVHEEYCLVIMPDPSACRPQVLRLWSHQANVSAHVVSAQRLHRGWLSCFVFVPWQIEARTVAEELQMIRHGTRNQLALQQYSNTLQVRSGRQSTHEGPVLIMRPCRPHNWGNDRLSAGVTPGLTERPCRV
jgi:hypothetical protein